MTELNIFEFAAKNKIRFAYHGFITTEDLYDLTVSQLDGIFKDLNRQKKSQEEESLLSTKSANSTLIDIQIELIKHVVSEKQAEAERRKQASEIKAKRQIILEALAEKNDAELRGKSAEELKKMLEELN